MWLQRRKRDAEFSAELESHLELHIADNLRALDELVRDIVFATRLLARDRGFTITAAAVLGIGLAVTNTFFILTNSIVIRGLPIEVSHARVTA